MYGSKALHGERECCFVAAEEMVKCARLHSLN
jgi:hypothetical protein